MIDTGYIDVNGKDVAYVVKDGIIYYSSFDIAKIVGVQTNVFLGSKEGRGDYIKNARTLFFPIEFVKMRILASRRISNEEKTSIIAALDGDRNYEITGITQLDFLVAKRNKLKTTISNAKEELVEINSEIKSYLEKVNSVVEDET